jgi:hypothetical protein
MNSKLIILLACVVILIELEKFSSVYAMTTYQDSLMDEGYNPLSRLKYYSRYIPLRHYAPLRPYYSIDRRSFIKPFDSDVHGHYPHHEHGLEKSELYYVLPILVVLGLGSFIIPVISTLFTAMITSNNGALGFGCCKRRRDENVRSLQTEWQEKIADLWSIVETAFSSGKLKNTSLSNNSTKLHQSKL